MSLRSPPLRGIDTLASNLVLSHVLYPTLRRLADAGVFPVALKGFGLLHTHYRHFSGDRPMVDVDLLLRPSELRMARPILTELGFEPLPAGQPCYVKTVGKQNIRVDIHTDVFYMTPAQTAAFRARSRPVRDPDAATLRVPEAEDHFLYIANHAVLRHGQLRPQWAEDLDRVARGAFDWERLRERTEECQSRLPVWLVLRSLVARGKHLPRGFLQSLEPRGRDRLGALVFAAIMRRREVSDIGHLLRFLVTEPGKTRTRMVVEHMLPSDQFLTVRYGLDGPPSLVQRALRPLRAIGRAGRLCLRLARAPRHARPEPSASGSSPAKVSTS